MEELVLNYKDKAYPKELLKINNYPKELYVKGNIELLNNNKKIAIVGSRKCTEYGSFYAQKFSKILAKRGISIISGMAIGIDESAHIGAMGTLGNTIAVLGSGFKKILTEEGQELCNNILKNNGCIITEYAPEIEATSKNFPKRNRIISGISNGVLVIEAGYKSGSTITARLAKEQGKSVFCLPNNISSKNSLGTNILLQQGANLVIDINDITNKLNWNCDNIQTEETEPLKIPNEFMPIYKYLSKTPTHINDLAKLTKMSIVELSSSLTMLELEGYVEKLTGNEFKI